jgi:hypothetical protein
MAMTQKSGLLIVIILLFVIAIGVSLFMLYRSPRYIQQSGENTTTNKEIPAVPASTASTTLFVDVDTATVSTNKLEIPVTIDTGYNTVSVVELQLSYDAKFLSEVSVQPGDFFSNPMIIENTIDSTKGTIVFTISSLTPRQGTGSIAIITGIPAEKSSSITLRIESKSRVAAIGELRSVLKNTRDGTVQVP